MNDPNVYITLALSGLAGLAMVELTQDGGSPIAPTAGARIEIADLKERIKKLEAIAAGVDL
jgi:hypothetical protein